MNQTTKTIIATSLAMVFVVGSTLMLFPQSHTSASYVVSPDRSLNLVNDLRTKNNLKPLVWNDKLAVAAQDKADDIISKGYFAHTSPDGLKAWDLILAAGYNYRFAGENLAIDYTSVDGAMKDWIASPSHYKNLVSDKYSDYGFVQKRGLVEGKEVDVYVQIFGSLK